MSKELPFPGPPLPTPFFFSPPPLLHWIGRTMQKMLFKMERGKRTKKKEKNRKGRK